MKGNTAIPVEASPPPASPALAEVPWCLLAFLVALPSLWEPFSPGPEIGNDAVRDLIAGLDIASTGALYIQGPAVAGGLGGHLGPPYYYFLALPWLTPDPALGLSMLLAAVRLATLLVLHATVRRLAGPRPAWVACAIYVTLPVVRETTNPLSHNELAPLFGGLALWTLTGDVDARSSWRPAVAALWIMVAGQLQLLFLAALPVVVWQVMRRPRGTRRRCAAAVLGACALPLAVMVLAQEHAATVTTDGPASLIARLRDLPDHFRLDAGWLAPALGGPHFLAAVAGTAIVWRHPSGDTATWRPVIAWLVATFLLGVFLRVFFIPTRYALVSSLPLAMVAAVCVAGRWSLDRKSHRFATPRLAKALRVAAAVLSTLGVYRATADSARALASPRPSELERLRRTELRFERIRAAVPGIAPDDIMQRIHGLDADGEPACSLFSACVPLLESSARLAARRDGRPRATGHFRWRRESAGERTASPLLRFEPHLDLTAATVLAGPAELPRSASLHLPLHAIQLPVRRGGRRPQLAVLPLAPAPMDLTAAGTRLSIRIPFRSDAVPEPRRVTVLAGAWHPAEPCKIEVAVATRAPRQKSARSGRYTETELVVGDGERSAGVTVRVSSCRLTLLDVFDLPQLTARPTPRSR